jgi:hypothetical protein
MAVEEHLSGPYRDDRVYVMRITNGAKRPEAPGEFVTGPTPASGGWVPSVLLITYRNVPSLPAIRADSFESIEKAIEYVKEVEPKSQNRQWLALRLLFGTYRINLRGKDASTTPGGWLGAEADDKDVKQFGNKNQQNGQGEKRGKARSGVWQSAHRR